MSIIKKYYTENHGVNRLAHLKGKANRHDSDGWLDFFTHDALYTLLTIQDSLKQEQR